ncbi:hypothetical protein BV25DRAFT_1831355 [Artomyces pyxidatus]|uniref:Uncharacterized protein n=1 Tax=Artomyces pyxidatus TaxID=48021 RepID=A0ACB8SMP0_9AGAM|nr:hypothetical protein BV25DRAFT_1831355 [Artomyces pyxidatus]
MKDFPTPVAHGASGAVYALATLAALSPAAQIRTIGGLEVSSDAVRWGLGGAVLADIVAVACGWRRFDHWAHLIGVGYGAAYHAFGIQAWNEWRMKVTKLWKVVENSAEDS